jgi:hypothetical protein
MDVVQLREIMGDAIRGLMSAYQQFGGTPLRTAIDSWYAAMWGKPGTNPAIASPDGVYDVNFDGSGCSGCGYYLTEGAPYSQKFFGQHFGISNQGSWPSMRVGGALPVDLITIFVSGRTEARGGSRMRVTVTSPTGRKMAPVTCDSSPCAVRVDRRLGAAHIQVGYVDANGKEISSGHAFTVTVR